MATIVAAAKKIGVVVCDNLDQNHTSDHRAEGFDEVIFDEAKRSSKMQIPPPLSCYICKARTALSTTKATQANLKNLPQLAILPS
ncbi:hypothetical protein [Campylobacter concisus]|uniref:hypothetical protein n=1 Tax=Campylobacter concisus TaxID=199 RepID=UPI0021563868|nr:hypothetical protein [Campylobacter concisus]